MRNAVDALPSQVHALGFSWRKRPSVRQFLAGHEVRFVNRPEQVPRDGAAAVWASGPFGHITREVAGEIRFDRFFMEDGFLRSVGLGADLVRPLSWVIDRRGIYYDARRPSDLEHLLQTGIFGDVLLRRASALRETIVSKELTKYNVGQQRWHRPAQARRMDAILVVGQVETDASIRCSAPGINTNLALLQAARQAHPRDWLLYKPHPDVVAGLRSMGAQEGQARHWCDEIVPDVPMAALLNDVDVVHVMTSLAGFEALLRGKRVVCHGLPFYCGWGLTEDVIPAPRRSRKLNVNQLVAGALIEYPTYVSRATGQFCPVEQAVAELVEWRGDSGNEAHFWRKLLRPLIRRA